MSEARNREEQLLRLFAERLNVEVPSVETDLIETSLVDSLAFVELLAQVEAAFGIHVALDDLDIDRFRTISRIAHFIATKTARSPLAAVDD
ncbi:MAG TPA: acyl carrier protein [Gemmatimonadales bacterium]|nr:acyl carrier protein [Gemmatimonadales bacterium]